MQHRTSGGARTLPAHYYTSPEIFQLEAKAIFGKRWIYAGSAAQLTQPGSYFLLDFEGESLIILRQEDQQIRCFYNVCRHRGTRLCKEKSGDFTGGIRCPYHAWTYDLDGQLIGAPNMQEVPGFKRQDYPLHGVAAAVWEGNIFININPDAAPFEAYFEPLLSKFSRWEIAGLESVHRLVYDVAANWKLILQNYSECYHCPTLHPTLNRLTPYRDSINDLEEGPFLGGPMKMSIPDGSMTMTGQRCAPPLAGLSDQDHGLVYYYVVFPNFLLSLHPDYVLIHRLERISIDHTRIHCEWFYHPDAVRQPGFDPEPAIAFWNMTNLQDWEVCELSQKGISSRAYTPGPYSELESMIAALDREYLQSIGHLPLSEQS